MAPKTDPGMENGKTIRLSDGRLLGYAEYGIPSGKALLYFHGHPGSRYEAGFLAEAAAQAGIRLVASTGPEWDFPLTRRAASFWTGPQMSWS